MEEKDGLLEEEIELKSKKVVSDEDDENNDDEVTKQHSSDEKDSDKSDNKSDNSSSPPKEDDQSSSKEDDNNEEEKKGEEEKTNAVENFFKQFSCETITFIFVLFFFEVFMMFVGFFLLKNGQDKFIDDNPDIRMGNETISFEDETVQQFYTVFIHVALMIFVGFGLLMAFLRKGGFLAMGLAFLLACVASHWALFVVGYSEVLVELINQHDHVYEFIVLDIPLLIKSLFSAGAVLISMGVVFGKFSPLQMIIFVILEIPIYALNVSVVEGILHVSDVGGSMLVHTFGAYFGVAMSWIATRGEVHKKEVYTHKMVATRASNVYSMLGTVILWVYWPSFCGALEEEYQHRVILHTYLALTSGCVMTFVISRLLRQKFGMPDLQNSTLAAGVAIGTVANMKMPPGAAMAIGMLAGALSVFGYKVVQPAMAKAYLHDTCGVHNLHGMPGILGGLAGVFASIGMKDHLHHGKYQPLIQLAGLCITVSIGLVGGAIVGGGLRIFTLLYPPTARDYFEDDVYFNLKEEKEQEEYDTMKISSIVMEDLERERDRALLESKV